MAECQLICIDPARAGEFWPQVAPLIRRAMERGDMGAFAPVEKSVLAGEALLWLAIAREGGRERPFGDGAAIAAAAVTELQRTEQRLVCVIVACGAPPSPGGLRRGLDDRSLGEAGWLPLIAGIEAYARAEGCSAVRIIGRKGWIRILTAYRPRRVVLEKELH